FFQAEDGIRDKLVTGVQTCALPIFVTFANFDIVRILTSGGPIDQTHIFATWAFKLGIEGNDIPLGASVSLFMFPILAIAAIFIRSEERRVGKECRYQCGT